MKRFATLLIALGALLTVFGTEMERQAVYEALDSAENSLKKVDFKGRTVAVVHIDGDNWGLNDRLANMLNGMGAKCVVDRNNPEFIRLVSEIHRNNRELLVLDPETVVKFGRLQAAEILVIGKVKEVSKLNDGKSIYAEIILQAYELATKRFVWGGSFASRLYNGEELKGLVAIDKDVNAALDKGFADAGKNLEDSAKLASKRKIIVVPLAGDVDDYITTKTIEMISGTKHVPVNAGISSPAVVASMIRDGEYKDHLVCYGAVRMLHKSEPVKSKKDGQYVTSFTVTAEIQLTIADPASNEVAWVRTIHISEDVVSAVEPVPGSEKIKQIPDEIVDDVANNWKGIIWGTVIGIIVLILIVAGIKFYFSYHRIR